MSITRRALTVSTAVALCAPHILRAQTVRRLRLGHNNSSASVTHTAAVVMAATIDKSSHGRLQIDVTPNSALGTEIEMLHAVVNSTLDLNISPVGTAAILSKDVDLMETPYLFKSVDQARQCLDGAMGRYCENLLRPQGVAVLGWSEVGLRHITAKKPVRSPADLQGLHIRVPVSVVILESFQAIGAKPETLAFPELAEALRTGRFDAQENPVSVIVANEFWRSQSHLSLTGHAYTSGPILMSTDVLEEFNETDRALLVAAAQAGAEASRVHSTRMETEGLDTLQKAGMTIVRDIDRVAFLKLGGTAMDHLAKSYGSDAVDRFRSTIA